MGALWFLLPGDVLSSARSFLHSFHFQNPGLGPEPPHLERAAAKGLKAMLRAAALIRLWCGGHETEFGRRFFVWSSLGSEQSCDLRAMRERRGLRAPLPGQLRGSRPGMEPR